MRIPLSSPDVVEADIEAVVRVLRTPRLSIGPRMQEFESAVASYVGVRHGVAVSSGTAGLHLSLRALGIGEGDEVILPSFTFIAVAHAVRYERAIPVFADIDPVSLNLTAETIEKRITPRTRAIVVVHTFGHPADLEPILDLAARHQLPVIEDACEALGAEYRGRKTGGIGRVGIFAFYPNKPITTGEGGMLVTDDAALADMFRALRNQGRRDTDGWLDHCLLGYNYRLPELNCALGLSQMGRLDQILDRRKDRALQYLRELENIPEVIAPPLGSGEDRGAGSLLSSVWMRISRRPSAISFWPKWRSAVLDAHATSLLFIGSRCTRHSPRKAICQLPIKCPRAPWRFRFSTH